MILPSEDDVFFKFVYVHVYIYSSKSHQERRAIAEYL